MIVVDVNVLVAAHMADHPHHETAYSFLTEALTRQSVLVPDAVWSGFFRVVTNGRIFTTPASITESVSFARGVIAAPGYRHVSGVPGSLETFFETLLASQVTAALVPDAYIASIARSLGCTVATFDRDFRRFDGITVTELA